MPIYTYLCKKCSKEFDFLIGINKDREELKCPNCGNKKVEKVFTTFGIIGFDKNSSKCSSCSGGNCSTCS